MVPWHRCFAAYFERNSKLRILANFESKIRSCKATRQSLWGPPSLLMDGYRSNVLFIRV